MVLAALFGQVKESDESMQKLFLTKLNRVKSNA